MPRLIRIVRQWSGIGTLAIALLLSGCELTSNWLQGRRPAEPVAAGPDEPRGDRYLNEMYLLASGDPATQAEIFADARSEATITPGPSTRLRYALVLATPGHAESDNDEAASLLRESLADADLLTTNEIALATIHLKDVESRLVLSAETRRLRNENSRAASTENAAIARRMAAIEAENRQLRQSLEEALAKLEALSDIERSIRQQAGNAENE